MKRLILFVQNLLLFLILLPVSTWAVEGDSLWSATFGGAGEDAATSDMIETSDDGLVMTGWTDSFGAGGLDFWIVKTNADGDSLWAKTFGGPNTDVCQGIVENSDGDLLLIGETSSFGVGSYDFWLVKADANGDSIWSRTYGGTGMEVPYAITTTTDNGYLIAGFTTSYGAGDDDFWLVKTDLNGDTLWTRTYGGSLEDKAISVIETSDGGYLLAGWTESFGAGAIDFWMVKTDLNGDSLWSNTFGGADTSYAYDVIETSDGGYLLAGYTKSFGAGSWDCYLVKTDLNGDSLWTKTIGGTDDDLATAVIETSDGNYLVTGATNTYGMGNYDYWLIKTDANGDSLWIRTYGGTNWDVSWAVVEVTGGGYRLSGNSYSFSGGDSDFWLVAVEGSPPEIDITLTPYGTPIVVPAGGGSFDFNISVENHSDTSVNFDLWTVIALPGMGQFEVMNVPGLSLPANALVDRDRIQNVPDFAPGGTYTYYAYVGEYPWLVEDSDSFTFEKEGSADGALGVPSDWFGYGDSFDRWLETAVTSVPTESKILGNFPNPFNPTTAISIQLSAVSQVNLSVYDVAGRKVATLVDGYRDAGVHEVTFDGTGLASGVYLYRLEVESQTAIGKMVLLK